MRAILGVLCVGPWVGLGQGSRNRREIQLTRSALPYDYTCLADGTPSEKEFLFMFIITYSEYMYLYIKQIFLIQMNIPASKHVINKSLFVILYSLVFTNNKCLPCRLILNLNSTLILIHDFQKLICPPPPLQIPEMRLWSVQFSCT